MKAKRNPAQSSILQRGKRLRAWAAALASVALMAGCQTPKEEKQANQAVRDYFNGDFRRAVDTLEPLSQKADENYVLNNLRLGSAASRATTSTARKPPFAGVEVINAGGVNSGGRAGGGGVDQREAENLERRAVRARHEQLYLGLVYYMRNDYNNARGAFENALFKLREYADDKDAEKNYREQESTFVLAHLMLGRCWQHLGRDDLAGEAFATQSMQPRLAALADAQRWKRSNVLLVVDFGYAPRKVTDYDGAIVGFSPPPKPPADCRRLA
jgi:tetratricopeptide (TPR) repeat protein